MNNKGLVLRLSCLRPQDRPAGNVFPPDYSISGIWRQVRTCDANKDGDDVVSDDDGDDAALQMREVYERVTLQFTKVVFIRQCCCTRLLYSNPNPFLVQVHARANKYDQPPCYNPHVKDMNDVRCHLKRFEAQEPCVPKSHTLRAPTASTAALAAAIIHCNKLACLPYIVRSLQSRIFYLTYIVRSFCMVPLACV